MTKQETNAIIEQVWTEQLQRTDDMPKDLANKYSLWLQGVMRQAAPLISGVNAQQQAPEQGAPTEQQTV